EVSFATNYVVHQHRAQLESDEEQVRLPSHRLGCEHDVAVITQAPSDLHSESVAFKSDCGDAQSAPVEEASPVGDGRGRLGRVELDRRYQVILDTFGQYGVSVSKPAIGVERAIEGPASILFR